MYLNLQVLPITNIHSLSLIATMSNPVNAQNGENPFEIYDVDFGRKLLREYSGIPDEDINNHIELIVSLASPLNRLWLQLMSKKKNKALQVVNNLMPAFIGPSLDHMY